jgi:hypothetical protein
MTAWMIGNGHALLTAIIEVVAAERTDMTRFPVMFGGIARPTSGGTGE